MTSNCIVKLEIISLKESIIFRDCFDDLYPVLSVLKLNAVGIQLNLKAWEFNISGPFLCIRMRVCVVSTGVRSRGAGGAVAPPPIFSEKWA